VAQKQSGALGWRGNLCTWNPRLNFNNGIQEYSPRTTWFYSKIVWHQPCFRDVGL